MDGAEADELTEGKKQGPRVVTLHRGDAGFGFTLRHFIVYPPEPSELEPGSSQGSGSPLKSLEPLEPMDTIFVKNVRSKSPAQLAGLYTGDRIVNVNGESVAGKSYAQVVQMIQRSSPNLQLLVVSKEDDILQKYFSATAHNPETNPRPHELLPPRFISHLPRPKPYCPPTTLTSLGSNFSHIPFIDSGDKTPTTDLSSPPSFSPPAKSPLQVSIKDAKGQKKEDLVGGEKLDNVPPRIGRDDQGRVFEVLQHHPQPSNDVPYSYSLYSAQPRNVSPKVLSSMENFVRSTDDHKRDSLTSLQYLPSKTPPLDSELNKRGSIASACDLNEFVQRQSKTDSIINRIKKSFEQKEEFLLRSNSPVSITPPPRGVNKEYYVVPQKFQKVPWPPTSTQAAQMETGEETTVPSSNRPVQSPPPRMLQENLPKDECLRLTKSGKSFVATLDKIQENIPIDTSKFSETHENAGPRPLPFVRPSDNEKISELHLVSERAKQFETGHVVNEAIDNLNFYQSELSRLTAKQYLPNVSSRKQEYEIRSKDLPRKSEPSLKSKVAEPHYPGLSGNRLTIVGGPALHCLPPGSSSSFTDDGFRMRTSSIDSESSAISDLSEDTGTPRRKAFRQNSYLAAIKSPVSLQEYDTLIECSTSTAPTKDHLPVTKSASLPIHRPLRRQPSEADNHGAAPPRPSSLPIRQPLRQTMSLSPNLRTISSHPCLPVVAPTALPGVEDYHAFWKEIGAQNGAATPDTPVELNQTSTLEAHQRHKPTGTSSDVDSECELQIEGKRSVHKLKSLFGDKENRQPTSVPVQIIREGFLNIKSVLSEGKKAADRSWKQIWGVLTPYLMYLLKEKRPPTMSLSGASESEAPIAVDQCSVDIAYDYTKKKHVFRLNTQGGTEYLMQAEDNVLMVQWIRAIQDASSRLKQEGSQRSNTLKKLTRSPTGHSPKTRKPSTTSEISSPKSKNWKGRVAKQWKKMHGQSPATPQPGGITFGVPLEFCPPSSACDYVPLLVELCTSMVETRGLHVVGIYRIPGNAAAVAALSESINHGFDQINLQDPRWNDMNVISSLLKSFFRKLPDPVVTSELYPAFINASKVEEPKQRLHFIKKLLNELPDAHYHTLAYLTRHLARVAAMSDVNKMDARNLAIVFGPTLIRTASENVLTMVTDMAHQCTVLESLITHMEWFFGESTRISSCEESPQSHSLLMRNVPAQNVPALASPSSSTSSQPVSAKEIVSSIIAAANRKTYESRDETYMEVNIDRSVELRNEKLQQVEAPETAQHHESIQLLGNDESLGDEVSVRTYSPRRSDALRQRLKQLEMETRAMLSRGKGDASKRLDEDRQRVEKAWQQAKHDLENQDFLDHVADNPSDLARKLVDFTTKMTFLSAGEGNKLRRIPVGNSVPTPWRAYHSPRPLQRGNSAENVQAEESQAVFDTSKVASNGTLKRLKSSSSQQQNGSGMGGVRCGSLDSLRDYYQDSGTRQEPSSSDDGSDLLSSITASLDQPLARKETPDIHYRVVQDNEDSAERSGKPLTRSNSLSKSEKTDLNRQAQMKQRRNSAKELSDTESGSSKRRRHKVLKRRHTVGGTKDFEKFKWFIFKSENQKDNKMSAWERLRPGIKSEERNIKLRLQQQQRASSPDLSDSQPLESHV